MTMTKEEHRERHIKLHRNLDELAADFIEQEGKRISQVTVLELMEWSHQQTIEPTEKQPA